MHGRDLVTEYTLAATKDGTLTHCRARVKAAMGAYLQLVTPGIPLLGAWIYAGPYAIPNYSVDFKGALRTRRRRTPTAEPGDRRRLTSSSGRWTRSPTSSGWTSSSCGGRTSS